MIELTPEQRAELERCGDVPLVITDPVGGADYVVLRRSIYEEVRSYVHPLLESVLSPQETTLDAASEHRRDELIDRKYDRGLSAAEAEELAGLQAAAAERLQQIAPRPLALLDVIELGLRHRLADPARE